MDRIKFTGKGLHPEYAGDIVGEANIEMREDGFYYSWQVKNSNGIEVASQSMPVSYNVISREDNWRSKIAHHVIAGINKYRISRIKAFEVLNWQWR